MYDNYILKIHLEIEDVLDKKKWTMAMQFSFEYCIDPKDHKSEEDIKAIAVEGAMWPKL